MTKFHLCEEGWKLYMEWSRLLDEKAPSVVVRAARDAYREHRAECEECVAWEAEDDSEKVA